MAQNIKRKGKKSIKNRGPEGPSLLKNWIFNLIPQGVSEKKPQVPLTIFFIQRERGKYISDGWKNDCLFNKCH